jgi:glyoxylase-like metal-dependent hydrolase (beta-lactamase superfamily II)
MAAEGMPDIAPSAGGVRVERVVTSGTFELDGGSWEVDNNVWIVGDDEECLIIDPAHDARRIVKSIPRERKVVGVICTHAHNDHINGVGEVCDATRAPAYLHPQDRVLWDQLYPVTPDRELGDGDVIRIGDVDLHVLHTPGLFSGGPGATGRSYSDFPTIIESIRDKLLTLPDETVVLTGHGDATVIGAEAPYLQDWIDRGH